MEIIIILFYYYFFFYMYRYQICFNNSLLLFMPTCDVSLEGFFCFFFKEQQLN